ncbi:hypothetical protein BH20ACT18_BH20ACT18_05430 [soil metagenome]
MDLADTVAQLVRFERRGRGPTPSGARRCGSPGACARPGARPRLRPSGSGLTRRQRNALAGVAGSVLAAFLPIAAVAVLAAALASPVLDVLGRLWLANRWIVAPWSRVPTRKFHIIHPVVPW